MGRHITGIALTCDQCGWAKAYEVEGNCEGNSHDADWESVTLRSEYKELRCKYRLLKFLLGGTYIDHFHKWVHVNGAWLCPACAATFSKVCLQGFLTFPKDQADAIIGVGSFMMVKYACCGQEMAIQSDEEESDYPLQKCPTCGREVKWCEINGYQGSQYAYPWRSMAVAKPAGGL